MRSKNGKYGPIDGKYVICKKNHEDGNECQPTKWFIKTKWAYQTSKNHGVSGSTNGYKLSPKITELMSIWQAKLANGEL